MKRFGWFLLGVLAFIFAVLTIYGAPDVSILTAWNVVMAIVTMITCLAYLVVGLFCMVTAFSEEKK